MPFSSGGMCSLGLCDCIHLFALQLKVMIFIQLPPSSDNMIHKGSWIKPSMITDALYSFVCGPDSENTLEEGWTGHETCCWQLRGNWGMKYMKKHLPNLILTPNWTPNALTEIDRSLPLKSFSLLYLKACAETDRHTHMLLKIHMI